VRAHVCAFHHPRHPHPITPHPAAKKAAAAAAAAAAGGGAPAPSGAKQQVIIEVKERGKRRHVTTVTGLDSFGVKLKEAASALGKKFGAGATVSKSPTGIQEIDVQGDVAYDLPDLLLQLYDVPKKAIIMRE
jgi:density-regulated protein DRP1